MQDEQPDPHAHARRRMVAEQLEARDITDPRVLDAIAAVPRHAFVPAAAQAAAYSDRALSLDCGQTISQPYIVALMTQAARLDAGHRVLEVGTGSGYQCAVLARLVGWIYTVERIAALSGAAQRRLNSLGLGNVTYRVADGSVGWPQQAPFDRILVTAGAPDVPAPLVDQLADGGRLVIPIGRSDRQTLTCVQRVGHRTVEESLVPCRFVKLIGKVAWHEKTDPASV